MRRKALWRGLALALTATLVMTACGDDDEDTATGGTDTTAAAETVTIAFMGALTGDNANLGINIRDGIKLAIEEANAEGDGPTIALKEFDTAGDPAQAGTVKDQVIADDVVGPAFSGETKAVIPAFEDAGLAMISPSATNTDLPNVVPNSRVFHRIIADDSFQASGVAAYLANDLKPATVSYIHDNSEYGKGLTDDVVKQAGDKGIKAASAQPLILDPKAQDFSSTVNSVLSAKPGAVFYGGYYAEAGRLKKQLTDAGFTGTFVSGDGSLDPGFVDAAGAAAAEGAQLSCPCNLAFETSEGKLKEFYDAFKAEIGKEPGLYSPEGFDAANVLIEGIKAGNTDRESLLTWLEEDFESLDGVSKKVEFAENGNTTSRDFFVFQVKDGKLAPSTTVEVS